MSEYEIEPVPGLPEALPEGEHILWQGAPDWIGLAQRAFHLRGLTIYFGLLLVWALYLGSLTGIGLSLVGGVLGVGIVAGLGWLSAKTTLYTITNKRVVMRYGMVLQKCVNLPLGSIGSAGFAKDSKGRGDIVLQLTGAHRLGYLQFWPHARPWKLAKPEPMLRSLRGVDEIAATLQKAVSATQPAASSSPASGLQAMAA
jgi:Bacterial PH domain